MQLARPSVNTLPIRLGSWRPVALDASRAARLMLMATFAFNVVDALLTWLLVDLQLAVEANPLMAAALQQGPVVFFMVKMGIVSLGVATLWRYRERTLAAVGIGVTFVAYAALMIYHVQSVRALAAYLAA